MWAFRDRWNKSAKKKTDADIIKGIISDPIKMETMLAELKQRNLSGNNGNTITCHGRDELYDCINKLVHGEYNESVTNATNIPTDLLKDPSLYVYNTISEKVISSIQARRFDFKGKIITLCGSSRFKDEFDLMKKSLAYNGNIVLSLDFFNKSENNTFEEDLNVVKSKLRELHLCKIYISDEIFVINKDGYIGEDTKLEIEYAESLGIPVNYLEPLKLLDHNPDRHFKKGTVVKHFKRELLSEYDKKYTSKYLYLIEGVATHTETNESLVIYKSLSEDMKIYVRPESDFYSLVDKEKYPDIKQEYRFEEYIKD